MSDTLENHVKEAFKLKDSMHFLSLLQSIKSFTDNKLLESAGKDESERTKILFSTVLDIRDTVASELVEYTVSRRVTAAILEHSEKVQNELNSELQEQEDLATFEQLQSDSQKKS